MVCRATRGDVASGAAGSAGEGAGAGGAAVLLGVFLVAVVSAQRPGRPVVYAAVGAELTQFDVDVERATLTKRASMTLPANVQEAALHPSGNYLYIGTSNGGSSYVSAGGGPGPAGSDHRLQAFRIDRATGALVPHGAAAPLPSPSASRSLRNCSSRS